MYCQRIADNLDRFHIQNDKQKRFPLTGKCVIYLIRWTICNSEHLFLAKQISKSLYLFSK